MSFARSRRRPAFTMIELMIAIVIVAVLVALAVPALTSALRRGGEMRAKQELSQLDAAVQSFMSYFGVNYIPSRIKLCTTQSLYPTGTSATQLDTDSQQYLQKLFPKLASSGSAWASGGSGVNWTSHPLYTTSSGVSPGTEILEGHQCLVFFLGGIQAVTPGIAVPGQTYTGSCTGFSADPTNPANTSTSIARIGPFFDFQPGQLVYIPHYSCSGSPTDSSNRSLSSLFNDQGYSGGWSGTPPGSIPGFPSPGARNLSNAIFLSYLDTYKQQPYAYFSSYKGINGYTRYQGMVGVAGPSLIQDNASLLAIAPSSIVPPTSGGPTMTGGFLSIQPYATSPPPVPIPSPTTTPTAFYKPDRYQILCAGQDGKWGLPPTAAGGTVQGLAPYGLWLPDGSNCTNDGKDDLSNFTSGKMAGGQ